MDNAYSDIILHKLLRVDLTCFIDSTVESQMQLIGYYLILSVVGGLLETSINGDGARSIP